MNKLPLWQAFTGNAVIVGIETMRIAGPLAFKEVLSLLPSIEIAAVHVALSGCTGSKCYEQRARNRRRSKYSHDGVPPI